MIVQKATLEHVEGISRVCSEGYRNTYKETHSAKYIERIIKEFYNHERVAGDVNYEGDGWDGYFVALDDAEVVGAIGGGMIEKGKSEVFVLYLDPSRRGEGIGTLLLKALSDIQVGKGATEQWVSVAKGNQKGIPFYEARGFEFVEETVSYANEATEEYVSYRYRRKLDV
ncbi:GNAT family N-acetyltransferase [Pseudalkalibacillus salsuginis]|uniref:GNAT family N-acetyltransferase n=1 Tax=Pseudalkalibacillus salsuginis TaxID=2910972 RepID=UPI001F1F1D02|nr:GNAT family N-acetyltransferase [Pseudalkalibacillus salsuginis]MCF6410315.1 GNAT family N-acetyltransferase [Pseudalkalibacillus salsuginis]